MLNLPRNSYIVNVEQHCWSVTEFDCQIFVTWRDLDTGEETRIEYRDDITQTISRLFNHICAEQCRVMDLPDLGVRTAGLREIVKMRVEKFSSLHAAGVRA